MKHESIKNPSYRKASKNKCHSKKRKNLIKNLRIKDTLIILVKNIKNLMPLNIGNYNVGYIGNKNIYIYIYMISGIYNAAFGPA